ncbi:MAG: DUF3501 family protein [Alphaproteobacteria bacterium]
MTTKHEITRADVLPMSEFAAQRRERRREISEIKRNRRVEIGPYATLYFENYDTMWWQVHEMLFIERGGEAQIDDELGAYNPLIPKGEELVATLMFEIDDGERRERLLSGLGGVENGASLSFDGETVAGVPEGDVERSTAEGRASSVHFLHFPFTAGQVAKFRTPGTKVVAAIDHPGYGHMAVMPEAVRAALAEDFDD